MNWEGRNILFYFFLFLFILFILSKQFLFCKASLWMKISCRSITLLISPCSLGIDPGQLELVVLDELYGVVLELRRCTGLHEAAHLVGSLPLLCVLERPKFKNVTERHLYLQDEKWCKRERDQPPKCNPCSWLLSSSNVYY